MSQINNSIGLSKTVKNGKFLICIIVLGLQSYCIGSWNNHLTITEDQTKKEMNKENNYTNSGKREQERKNSFSLWLQHLQLE